MKIAEPIKRVLKVTRKELYSCGWNGNKQEISKYIKCLLEETSYENYEFTVLNIDVYSDNIRITLELLVNEEDIYIDVSSLTFIPCPNCYGDGEIEYVGVRSYYEKCNHCNGTGKIELKDLSC